MWNSCEKYTYAYKHTCIYSFHITHLGSNMKLICQIWCKRYESRWASQQRLRVWFNWRAERGGGREREVLNGTPKPLRGSVGKVTWPELGPFYIRRQSNLSCVWTVRYFVGSDFFFSLLINYLLHHHITIRGGGDVSCERIKLISGTIMPTGRWWDSNYVSALCWPLPFYKSEINQLSLLQSFVLLKPKSAFLNQYLKKEEEEENVKK